MFINFSSWLIGLAFFLGITFCIYLMFRAKSKKVSIEMTNLLLFCALLGILRIMLPVEFHFTKNFHSQDILPFFVTGLDKQILGLSIKSILLLIYLSIVIILVIRRASMYLRFKKVLRKARPLEPTILASTMNLIEWDHRKKVKVKIVQLDYISEPVLVGLFHPTIVLPKESLNSRHLPYILKHEVEHYLHHDILIKTIMEYLCILLWWNPCIYLLRHYLSNILEFRNDLKINREVSEKERIRYLETLIQTAKNKTQKKCQFSLGFQQVSKSFFQERVLSVLHYKKENEKKTYKFAYLIPIVFFIASLCIVVEPYFITSEETVGTFSLEDNKVVMRQEERGYTVVVDGKDVGVIKAVPPEFKNVKIIEGQKQ